MNPRIRLAYDGLGQEGGRRSFMIDDDTITFDRTKAGGSASVGLAVKMSGDKEVALVGDGDIVVGRLESVEADGVCIVTVEGCVKLPAGSGATVTAGSAVLGALGVASAKGYVKNGASALARGTIYDASDTTAVVVEL